MSINKSEVFEYHSNKRPGKIEVVASKPLETQHHLSLAYTPGVAEVVLAIAEQNEDAYSYTAKANLVAVISNGTAILGLGNLGALASKPVMEGKGVLFKQFADIDVFDIEVDTEDAEKLIEVVQAISPTFGGINLEDIKSPECFEIEQRLINSLDIPVFHDDQHGTAIISGAALLNALKVTGKSADELRVVVSGAGASAISCSDFYITLGVKPEHIMMVDSRGVIFTGRDSGMNKFKERFAIDTDCRTLEDAVRDSDLFLGLSVADLLTPEMLLTMADQPIIFAMANPDPEINYDLAKKVRPDTLVATGRSDFPNQINNVLGFPFIFRGALDVGARTINDDMKIAAAHALAELTHEDVPDSVLKAYGLDSLTFGPDYLIPKPFDPRVLIWESAAVAEAAIRTGVARQNIDLDVYREQLASRLGHGRQVHRHIINVARQQPKRIVFPEGEENKIIRAAAQITERGIGHPILLGRPEIIEKKMANLGLTSEIQVVDPSQHQNSEIIPENSRYHVYTEAYYRQRERHGVTLTLARERMSTPNIYGMMMVHEGDADTFLSGLTYEYPDVIRPALQLFGTQAGTKRVTGAYLVIVEERVFIFTDATVNVELDENTLAEAAILAADFAKTLEINPRVAMLSFSNFGSSQHPISEKVRRAVKIVQKRRPDLEIDGEMQADVAVSPELIEERFPFSKVKDANVLVFPSLASANIAYKLLQQLTGASTIGPVLLGMGSPVHVLQAGDNVDQIVNMSAVAVMDAQGR
jgi:malate dehydrogenase (oxaloacetate-decarboxylating)(NADP+)